MFGTFSHNVNLNHLDEQQKYIWNAALETAAKAIAKEGDYNPVGYYMEAIRKLKK